MAITKIFQEFLSNSSVEFAPSRTFISSSYAGVTGSINVIVNRSSTQKDNIDMREGLTNQEGSQKFDENTFEGRRKQIYEGKKTVVGSGTGFVEDTTSYNYDLQLGLLLDGANPTDSDGDGVADDALNFPPEYFKKEYTQLNLNFAHTGYSDLPMHPRNAFTQSIRRFVPGTNISSKEYRRKEVVRQILEPAYQRGHNTKGWGYTNNHCVHFFSTTSSTGSRDIPIMAYPNRIYGSAGHAYEPEDEIQIDFWAKMSGRPTKTGTLLHLPFSYAVSIATGSNQGNLDSNGHPQNYRLVFQLGPDATTPENYPDKIDLSIDNNSRHKGSTAKITIAELPGNSETLSITFGVGRATASITAVETDKDNLDGDTIIISDSAGQTVTFTYDKNEILPTRVDATNFKIPVKNISDAEGHAESIRAAISAAQIYGLDITATASGTVVSLAQDSTGTSGNTTISGTAISQSEVTVTQFSGGGGSTPQVITFSSGGSAQPTSFSSNAATIYRGTAATAAGTASAIATLANSVAGFTASAVGTTVTIEADTAAFDIDNLSVSSTLASAPTISVTRGSPGLADMCYQSKDFLTASYWHHCAIRYSPTANAGTGSFVIDGRTAGTFVPPSDFNFAHISAGTRNSYNLFRSRYALFLGAYSTIPQADGTGEDAPGLAIQTLFSYEAAETFGTKRYQTVRGDSPGPYRPSAALTASNGLNGVEFHEVKIANKVRSLGHIRDNLNFATASSDELLFHLPVLYSSNAPLPNYDLIIGDMWPAYNEGHTIFSETSANSLVDFYANKVTQTRHNESDHVRELKEKTSDFLREIDYLGQTEWYSNDLPSTYYGGLGGIFRTYDAPFNTHHANNGGFLNINAENYLRDFVTGNYPYLHLLSGSSFAYDHKYVPSELEFKFDESITGTVTQHFLTSSWKHVPTHKQRNLLILPCDNGLMKRSYEIYDATTDFSGSVLRANDPSVLDVSNVGDFSSIADSSLSLVDEGWNSLYDLSSDPDAALAGPTDSETEEAAASSLGSVTTTVPAQRFFSPYFTPDMLTPGDYASSMVVFFNVPSLFYGNSIAPKSLKMSSFLYVTGSDTDPNAPKDRLVEMCLMDDGNGGIYRANTSGSIATDNIVGNVYYSDGIIALKSPHLFMFGENHFDIRFKGQHNIHMLEAQIPAAKTLFNSSSNPNFAKYSANTNVNDDSTEFVYFSGMNFHDENMNVVARAKFAQPLIKRTDDEFLIRVKFDF